MRPAADFFAGAAEAFKRLRAIGESSKHNAFFERVDAEENPTWRVEAGARDRDDAGMKRDWSFKADGATLSEAVRDLEAAMRERGFLTDVPPLDDAP